MTNQIFLKVAALIKNFKIKKGLIQKVKNNLISKKIAKKITKDQIYLSFQVLCNNFK